MRLLAVPIMSIELRPDSDRVAKIGVKLFAFAQSGRGPASEESTRIGPSPLIAAARVARKAVGPARSRRDRGLLQPIVSVTTGAVVAAEALARFPGPPGRPGRRRLQHRARIGLGRRTRGRVPAPGARPPRRAARRRPADRQRQPGRAAAPEVRDALRRRPATVSPSRSPRSRPPTPTRWSPR